MKTKNITVSVDEETHRLRPHPGGGIGHVGLGVGARLPEKPSR